jgi:two-component system sensor histidine kinase BaeS
VTRDRPPGLGPLGRRLLVVFVAVALSSVVVLSLAALVGTDQGLASAQRSEQEQAAGRAAELTADAYAAAGGWPGAELAAVQAVADAAGAELVVRDRDGTMVWPGRGLGAHHMQSGGVSAPVTVGGEQVGTVGLRFAGAAGDGRGVAWSWVAGAAIAALLVAVAASWLVSRWLARPLARLAGAAHRFAAGERTVRSGVRAPGELGEVARAFDTMAEEVVRADTVRRRLAADVAHELRTPLAGLQAGLEELRDGLARPEPARLAGLHDQALRLGRVVDDLSELAAAESAALSLHLAVADLAALVRSTVATQEPTLRAAGLAVATDLPDPVPVRVDADRIHQAVVNLLANAARYCRPGDRVSLRVSASDGVGVVEVADTGPGIPPDELPHVFQRLWRGSGSRTVAGAGIGLAVVRELVAAHGGTVAADSTPGAGARFTIRLPLASPSDLHTGGTPPAQPRGTVRVSHRTDVKEQR